MLLACVCIPLGIMNTLWDGCPVGMKACYALSFVVPMWDVAPLLAMADGMELLRIPSLIWLWRGLRSVTLLILLRGGDVSCASTWQGGGPGSNSIE